MTQPHAETASYDAAGNLICRAPDGSVSCAGGTNTGQQLTWDTEGRLTTWQNTPTSPSGCLFGMEAGYCSGRTRVRFIVR
jgi:hypothetical protein